MRTDPAPASEHVLVVDDDPAIRFVLEQLVSSCGWGPLVASSGPEALALLARADAVVTDFSMPGMDGVELLREVHRRDGTLPVILVSGSDGVGERAMCAGAYEFLSKPFDVDRLSVILRSALQARRLHLLAA